MKQDFPKSSSPIVPLLALLGACVLAVGLFLLVPLTQAMEAEPTDIVYQRSAPHAPPPPPRTPPPPEEVEPEEMLIQPKPPVLEQEAMDVETTQLELSLAPGMGVPLRMGVPNMPTIQKLNTVQEIKDIFNFDEVDNPPSPLNAGQIRVDYPRELSRRGIFRISVVLEVIIDKTGKLKVKRLISSSYKHPKVEIIATRTAEQIRFTISKKNGRPVSVLGRFPLELEDPRRRR